MSGSIIVDVWAGEMHQTLTASHKVETWTQAFLLIENAVEAGFLVNVLHSDFLAPPEKVEAFAASILQKLRK